MTHCRLAPGANSVIVFDFVITRQPLNPVRPDGRIHGVFHAYDSRRFNLPITPKDSEPRTNEPFKQDKQSLGLALALRSSHGRPRITRILPSSSYPVVDFVSADGAWPPSTAPGAIGILRRCKRPTAHPYHTLWASRRVSRPDNSRSNQAKSALSFRDAVSVVNFTSLCGKELPCPST